MRCAKDDAVIPTATIATTMSKVRIENRVMLGQQGKWGTIAGAVMFYFETHKTHRAVHTELFHRFCFHKNFFGCLIVVFEHSWADPAFHRRFVK